MLLHRLLKHIIRENKMTTDRGKRVDPFLEVFNWQGVGYQPFVFEEHWQVAILNWEPIFDLENAKEVEAHRGTDEVFVLTRGSALLFVGKENGLRCEEMQPGAIYNVTRGTFHNLLATRDASWIIVETRDTDLNDTTTRPLTPQEIEQLRKNAPDWALQ